MLGNDMQREIRKRLFWGAFVTDATQALYLGRPTSLPIEESRVPLQLLDTYEELEEWSPYIDHTQESTTNGLLLAYQPKPAFAVSTFVALAKLFRISTRVSQTFYSINSIRRDKEYLMNMEEDLENQLESWSSSLPSHLTLNPDTDDTPPPHQITPQ